MGFKYINTNRVLGGHTLIGSSHVSLQRPNQDSLHFGSYNSGFCFVAVADGVGSCLYSQVGSRCAVRIIGQLCKRGPQWLNDARQSTRLRNYIISHWNRSVGEQMASYATTLNFVILGKNCMWVGQIGDGLVLVKTRHQFVLLEETTAQPPYTFALGGTGVAENFRLCVLKPCKQMSIFLCSDGVGRVLNSALFQKFLVYVRKLLFRNQSKGQKELKEWLFSLGKYNQDDKTFGVLLCR